ncbi:TetR/AcrR family transcriptional regulator C-terminal domain-containing protein [Streptomyces sp. MST-110588]|uniref:TetR/AcrR family transcriptional regulator C-terminal domain-containing protein n=1 Tax=Streptomyces sp. MST-110588 TaxID=2833628 RepID=UPI001F5E1A8C|nr:TetR/AcrR family transcriptional regulator C-terminal domain-containing protein [Streptomyces sp. MST-110588]UNO40854.1 TetR/AcrR family transcriptional regulator C-terminal domain-containing protein [Streptomyces sp. MST-110588]
MTPKRKQGERAGLTREQVLDAALALVDREGAAALTMRRLGSELGVEAMTLYNYVPNKAELLDALVERVCTQALPPEPAQVSPDVDWRGLLRGYADSLRQALLRHPRMLPLVATRPAVTPATLDAVERGLHVLTAVGFPLGRAVDALNALTLFVVGHTAAEAGIGGGEGGRGSVQWLAGLDSARYPLVVEAARTGAGVDDAARFDFAVRALLNGFSPAADTPSPDTPHPEAPTHHTP